MIRCKKVRHRELYIDHYKSFTTFKRKKLIDFFHTTEHLPKVAEAILGKSNKEADKWYEKYRELLLLNKKRVKKLIRSIQYYKENIKLQESQLEIVENELGFLKKIYEKCIMHLFLKKVDQIE